MTEWVRVHEGYIYQLTEDGKKIGRVRVKYEHENSNYKQYLYNVPKSWVSNNYVKEVPLQID